MPDLPTPAAPGGMGGIGFKAVVNALISIVRAINQLYTLMQTIFPTATSSVSSSATAGTGSALPATPQGYLQVTVNGVAYKVPLYKP